METTNWQLQKHKKFKTIGFMDYGMDVKYGSNNILVQFIYGMMGNF